MVEIVERRKSKHEEEKTDADCGNERHADDDECQDAEKTDSQDCYNVGK